MASQEKADRTRMDSGLERCSHHPKKTVKYVCLEDICQESSACGDCVVSTHQGHKLVKIRDLISMQADIQEFISHAEASEIPTLLSNIKCTELKISENRKHFQELTNEIRQRGCEMREKIALITDQLIDRAKKLEKLNTNALRAHRKQLEKEYEKVCIRVKKCKQTRNNGYNTDILELSEEIKNGVEIPNLPYTSVSEFEIRPSWSDQLEQVYGTLTNSDDSPFGNRSWTFSDSGNRSDSLTSPSASSRSDWSEFSGEPSPVFENGEQLFPETTRSHPNFHITDPSGTLHPVPRNIDLERSDLFVSLSTASGARAQVPVSTEENSSDFLNSSANIAKTMLIDSRFSHTTEILAIKPTSNRAWILSNGGRSVSLVNKNGEKEEQIELELKLVDISISPIDGNLWMIDTANNIREMTLEAANPSTRFYVPVNPFSICATSGNKILVGVEGQVQMFTTSGKLLQSSSNACHDNQLIKSPVRLAECPLSRNIGVINKDSAITVILMDGVLSVKFQYTAAGNGSSSKLFNPEDICFDFQGNLVIANNAESNKSVIVVDSKGHTPRPLYSVSNGKGPIAVGIDHLTLWAVFKKKRVKVFQYGE